MFSIRLILLGEERHNVMATALLKKLNMHIFFSMNTSKKFLPYFGTHMKQCACTAVRVARTVTIKQETMLRSGGAASSRDDFQTCS